jgi:2-amino-4-hydroxy-6-hydroxymethyldihydropteridine diphosphokinase
MNNLILHLGSNLGDRKNHIIQAIDLISARIGSVHSQSSYYETGAWGITDIPDFINIALWIKTELSPVEALNTALAIEKEVGRTPSQKWSSRIIDIDLLFYNDDIIEEENLSIPHAHISARNFVLIPLLEIIPDYIHPVLKNDIRTIAENCKDQSKVEKIGIRN